ncbi:hypothetical protein EG329_012925 [Mollisiaceae sp. DMI_Dod_QoI]|nr:hypothetical protein EG329_012925 [Helotiales sp. DMI_Dod_QoI]
MYSEHSAAIAAPPQRLRRPALSCLQCRRRKVKCDQKKPCSQCERSKDAVCTYRSDFNNSLSRSTPQIQETPKNPGRPRRWHAFGEDFHIPTPDPSTSTISVPHSPRYAGSFISSESSHADSHTRLPETPAVGGLQALNDKLPKKNHLPHMVYSPDIERQVVPGLFPDVDMDGRPSRLKMKLIGEAHWMNQMTQFDKIVSFLFGSERGRSPEDPSELRVLLQQCKKLARAIKSEHPLAWLAVPDFRSIFPSKEICDELIGNYLRTFESIYRIIHIPSFLTRYDEYWSNLEAENSRCSPFVIQLLLILAIGSTFQLSSSENPSLRSAARQWVYTAQQWLSAPLEKSRMNITGIQIQCLLILAREAVGIGSDLLWISAGSLLRAAMQLGYHRDPKHFPGMSIFHGEMRRRLWATIMELGIKESFGTAMPPLVSMDDFDTEPPANINDTDIHQETKTALISRDLITFTQTSLQIILLQSLPSRLEIARVTINFRSEPSYDDVLRLHSDITTASRTAQSFKTISNNQSLTPFHHNYFDFILHQPLISLHLPWAVKARTNPQFYFSRKICLDTCLSIVSFSPSTDYLRLLTLGDGIWCDIGKLPPLVIALELIMQLEEEALNPLPPSAHAKAMREPLIQAIRDTIRLKGERLREGGMNAKCHLFSSMTLGQIEAMEKGEDVEQGIAEAAIKSLRESKAILEERVSVFSKTGPRIETPSGCENQDYGEMGDAFDYGSFLDAGQDFDMTGSSLVEDWDDHFWL